MSYELYRDCKLESVLVPTNLGSAKNMRHQELLLEVITTDSEENYSVLLCDSADIGAEGNTTANI